jgi:alkyl hydroperoxide reductase 1
VNRYIPYTTDDINACGAPQTLDASKEWADKKVVLFAVPGMSPLCRRHDSWELTAAGAFTPTCSEAHLPGYINHLQDLKAKGVDVVGTSPVLPTV